MTGVTNRRRANLSARFREHVAARGNFWRCTRGSSVSSNKAIPELSSSLEATIRDPCCFTIRIRRESADSRARARASRQIAKIKSRSSERTNDSNNDHIVLMPVILGPMKFGGGSSPSVIPLPPRFPDNTRQTVTLPKMRI